MTLQNRPLAQRKEDTPDALLTSVFLLGAITLGGLAGVLSIGSREAFSQGIDTTILVMIFLLFFEVRLGGLARSARSFRFLAVAWSANFVVVPVLGFGIASLFFSGQSLLFVGMMIYFLAPCTDWFLGFTRLAMGDTELGAMLIPLNIITQLLLFPFWLWLFGSTNGLVEFSSIQNMLLHWFIVPISAAQTLKFFVGRWLPDQLGITFQSAASRCVPFVLAALIFQIFATHIGEIAAHLSVAAWVATAVFVFFIVTFAAGEILSRFSGFEYPQRALLAMTMAARNGPLMLALTAMAIPNQPLVLAVIVMAMLAEIPLLTALNQLLLSLRPER